MTLGAPRPDDHLYRLLLGTDPAGDPVFAPPYASLIGTGAPRTGKTRGVVIPAVASFPGSAVVVSVRGDVFEQTKASRRRRGPVAVFDPGELHLDAPERTAWDLLGRCEDFQFAVSVAQSLANVGHANGTSGVHDWHFWTTMARKVVAPALFAAASSGYGLADVVRWVQTREEFEFRALLSTIETDESALAIQMLESVWEIEERAKSSIYATADSMISPFESPAVARAVTDGIDVGEFLSTPGSTLYVVVPPTHQAVYAPIVTALIGTALDAAVEQAEETDRPARILVAIDEAGNVGRIPDLRERSSTSMGFGITMMSLLHDVSQLRRVYGIEDAQSILGSHHVVMALRGIDPHTARFFDDVIGEDPDPALPDGGGVARLRRIPDGYAVALLGGAEPTLIRLPSLDDPLLRLELEPSEEDPAPAPPPAPSRARRPVQGAADEREAFLLEPVREQEDGPVRDGEPMCAWGWLDPIDALPRDDLGHSLASRERDDAEADASLVDDGWEPDDPWDDAEPPEDD